MGRKYTLQELLADDAVEQRLVNYLAAHGGSSVVAALRHLFTGSSKRGAYGGVPFALAKAFFRAKPDVFILAGANDVALAHGEGVRTACRARQQPDRDPSVMHGTTSHGVCMQLVRLRLAWRLICRLRFQAVLTQGPGEEATT